MLLLSNLSKTSFINKWGELRLDLGDRVVFIQSDNRPGFNETFEHIALELKKTVLKNRLPDGHA